MRSPCRHWAGSPWVLLAVLWAAPRLGYSQSPSGAAVARLRQQVWAARHDTTRARLLIAITDDASVNDPDTIAALCQRVLSLADHGLHTAPAPAPAARQTWRRLQAAAYNNLGVAADSRGQRGAAIAYFAQALRIREQTGDRRGQVESHHNLGLSYSDHNDLLNALRQFDAGLALAQTLGDSVWIGIYARTLGGIYGEMGETAQQFAYLRRSLRVLRQTVDLTNRAEASLLLGNAYAGRGQPDSAARLLRQGLRLAGLAGDELQVSVAQRGLGLIALGAGQLDSAEHYLRAALRRQTAQDYASGLAPTLAGLGAVAAARRDWPAARRLTEQALALAERSGTRSQQLEIERQLSDFYAATADPAAALAHYRRYVALRDSVRHEQSQRVVLRQRLTAEATQREATLRAEQTKNRAVAVAEIRRQRLLRNALAAGALALLTVVALLAQRFRASQRARRTIAAAKEAAEHERDRADALLLNILPAATAAELKATGRAQAQHHAQVTVLFSDVADFTQLTEQLDPQALVSTLDVYFSAFDALCGEFQLEKIKTIGDAYLLAGGLNERPALAPMAVVRCALAMQAAVARLGTEREAAGLPIFRIRIGIHTGPVVAGVVGMKKFAYDIWGDTVNTAARMEQSGAVGRINISQATYQLVQAEFSCAPRGHVAAKHKGEIAMYFVEAERPAPLVAAP